MPVWTNLTPVEVGTVKIGSKTVVYENTKFEVLSRNASEDQTTLRCIEANPTKGYGLNAIVILQNSTKILYDTNMEEK